MAQSRGTVVLALPTDLLRSIAARLSTKDRLGVLPRVYKQWYSAIAGGGPPSGAAWEDLCIDIGSMGAYTISDFLAWLQPRAAGVRRLSLDTRYHSGTSAVLVLVRDAVTTLHVAGQVDLVQLVLVASCRNVTKLWLCLDEDDERFIEADLNCLGRLVHLQDLYLSGCEVQAVPFDALKNLTALTSLQLVADGDLDLQRVSALQNVQLLDVYCNSFHLVLPALYTLENLTLLDLRAYGDLGLGEEDDADVAAMHDVDVAAMRQLSALAHVNLEGNQLAAAVAAMSRLPNLQTLWVKTVSLPWPDSITQLTSLRSLCVTGGVEPIVQIPEQISILESLQRLELHEVHALGGLPARLSQLAHLAVLVITGSIKPFAVRGADIAQLPAIRFVVLANMQKLEFATAGSNMAGQEEYTLIAHHKALQQISLCGSCLGSSSSAHSLVAFTKAMVARGRPELLSFDRVPLPNVYRVSHAPDNGKGVYACSAEERKDAIL